MFYTPRLLLCLIFSLTVAGCNETTPSNNDIETQSKKVTAMTQQVTIKVGEQGESLKKRYPDLVRIQHQPAGIDFYDIDWNKPAHGVVTLEHGKHSFTVEDVLGISSPQDLEELAQEGLSEFHIYAGLTQANTISHDEARLKTHAILQRILQAGWKPLVGRGDPRISGKDQLNYMFSTSSVNGLDPRHVPTFEEWMRIESRTPWSFYADHLYLTVSFTRERTLTDPEKPGAYLLNFNIKSEAEEFRAYLAPLDRPKWKELLPAELAIYPQERAKAEATLRSKGIKIDESYEDPPVPNLK
jgi:hypothetical protein